MKLKLYKKIASGAGTMVEHMTHHLKVEGSSPSPTTGKRDKNVQNMFTNIT